jgi:SulP family sulfate permease
VTESGGDALKSGEPAASPRGPGSQDLRAGLVLGLESVPDGLASGLLAGVDPVAGLYGYLVGTVAGALATSSVFMSVQATGAMAVLIADVPEVHNGPDAARALFTLAVLTGAVMLVLGLLKLGTLVRFVPTAVVVGFINAVAVNIILGQLSNLTAYSSDGSNRVTRTIDTLTHPVAWDLPTVGVGALTIALILLLERTRLGALGLVVAVVLTSAATELLGWDSVAQLSDIAEVPRSLPTPVLPVWSAIPALLLPAVSLAFVGLVQGAAISQSMPNPDGRYPDASGDFRGQGVANIASGLLQGMPVGGSMSATSIVVNAGARSRWANVVASAVMAVVILVFAGAVGAIAMPALAGLLVLIGFRTFRPDQARMVWNTGHTQAVVLVSTFVLTILIPLQYAVLVGVSFSVLLFVARQSNKITITRWTFREGGALPREEEPPATLPPHEVVVLTVYGSLFFASVPVFEGQLPAVAPASSGSAVILRLRGKEDLGSTFITALLRYHEALAAVGSHLLLSGVGERVLGQLRSTGALAALGADNVFAATAGVGESLEQARARARGLIS